MKAIKEAVEYLRKRGAEIPVDILALAYGREIKQAGTYQLLRSDFWAKVYSAVYDFLTSSGPRTGPLTRMRIAVAEAYQDASYIAWEDAGEKLPLDDDTLSYIGTETASQLAYADSLFQRLLELRQEVDLDATSEALRTADRWAYGLDGQYNYVRMAAMKGKLLTWSLGATTEHCTDCSKLNGQRHRASWYRRRGFIPRQPGAEMECRGYRCDCSLSDNYGNEISI